MTPVLQVAFDCSDPHRLVRFWADSLGYEVEDNEEQITHLLESGDATPQDVMEYDGRMVWRTGAACRHPDGSLPRLLFQTVPEPRSGKNRVHLDIHVGTGERDPLIERMIEAGATRLWDGQQGPHTWVTLADPEGNEFCVA